MDLCIQKFSDLNGFRLGTEGRYSVTNGKMFLRVFCLFIGADILLLKLTSEGVEGAFVESDNQADLPVLDEGEVVPVRTTKRKVPSIRHLC